MSYFERLSKDTLTCVVLYLGYKDRISLFAAFNIAGNVDWVRLHGAPKVTDRIRKIHDSVFTITRAHRLAQMEAYVTAPAGCYFDIADTIDIVEPELVYEGIYEYTIKTLNRLTDRLYELKRENGTLDCIDCINNVEH